MEAFAIIGFIFGLAAFTAAAANKVQVKKLQDELAGLKQSVHDLRGG